MRSPRPQTFRAAQKRQAAAYRLVHGRRVVGLATDEGDACGHGGSPDEARRCKRLCHMMMPYSTRFLETSSTSSMGGAMNWYETIVKPSWAPPAATFGTVWGILYPIIIVAYGYVAYRAFAGTAPRALLLPIAVNLIANFAFTPIQFGLQDFTWASVDIAVVLITIIWSMGSSGPTPRGRRSHWSPT